MQQATEMRRVATGDGDERNTVWVTGITLMMRGLEKHCTIYKIATKEMEI